MALRLSKKLKVELEQLGLHVDDEGLCSLIALTGMSGADFSLSQGDRYRRPPSVAVKHVRSHRGKPVVHKG